MQCEGAPMTLETARAESLDERMVRVEENLRHTATKADLANLKFTLVASMVVLVSSATGLIIAVDRLAG